VLRAVRRVALVFALPLASCGGDHLDAAAEESLRRLGEREQSAARVLVEVERASRAEDPRTLCREVYVYEGAPPACERAFRRLFERQQSMALEVEGVELRDGTAVARAAITTLDNQGKRTSSEYTLHLVREKDGWHVEFQQ
jgi:hypothetical protein